MPPSPSSAAPAPPAAPAAPDAVVDYEKLTFALRPVDRTRPARAARLAVRESCTVFPRSHHHHQQQQPGAGVSGGGGATKKDAKAKASAKGAGILKTPRKSGGAAAAAATAAGSSPTANAATAMDMDGGSGADNHDGQDGSSGDGDGGDDGDDDASAGIGGGGSSSAPSDDKVDRSVHTMYVMDGDTGRIVSTARVRPVVVRDGLFVDDDDDDEEEGEGDDAAATKRGGGYEEVVGYEEIDETQGEGGDDSAGGNNDDGDAMDVDADGADGSASSAAATDAATKKSTPTKTASTPPGAASTSASSAEEGEEEEEDSGDEEYVPGSDPLTALQDQLPLESLPGRPTISFRRAEADGRLVALLKSRSAVAEDIVRGLARTTDEYSRHVGDGAASSAEEGGTRGGSSGLASLIMKDANSDETELRRRLRLEKRRLAMERPGTRSYLPPDLHEVMLGNWESQIDWEGVKVEEVGSSGGGSGSSDMAGADAAGSNPLAAGVAIMAEKSKSSSASALTVVRPPRKKLLDPQALLSTPYNPELDSMDFTSSVSWLGADAPPGHNTALARSVPLVLERSVAGRSVALPAAAPPVRPLPFGATNVFEARYERELSTVASSTASSLPGSSFRPDGDKLEAIIKAKQERRQKLATKKSHRIMEAMGTLGLGGGKGRTVTSSLMGPGGTERTGRVARGVAGGTSAHDAEYVEQLEMIYNHSMIKPDFTKIQLRQYHRPRLPRALVRTDRQWQFQIKVQKAKFGKSMDRVAGADGSTVLGSYQSAFGGSAASKTGSIRSESDLSASEGQLAIVEYCEERPLLQLLKGHTVRIVNYYRGDKAKTPISVGGGDRPARKRHHGDKASADDPNDAGASGKMEKPPRLKGPNQAGKSLLPSAADLIGVGKKKKKKDGISESSSALAAVGASSGDSNERSREANKVTILPDGVTEVLHPKVHGPFVGEVDDGMTQTGLVTNLFVAPMFRHESEPTDFLMILGKKPSSKHVKEGGEPQALGVCLRPFPVNVYTVGQIEPRVKVFQPNTNQEKNFTTPFVTYQIAKAVELSELRNDGEGLSLDEISSLFESNPIPPNALRMRIKQVATYDRESGHYTTKAIGFEDYPGVEALGRRFTPEGVAAYESSCAASTRLSDLGLQVLHTGASSVHSVGAAMVFLTSRLNAARERKSKMAKNLHFANTSKSKTTANQIAMYEKAAKKLDEEWKGIKRRHEVAKFIYEELQLAPWHLSNEFIDVHKNAQGTGMMRLTGLGDPSGRGEGYSFIRESDVKPNKGTGNSDGALNAQIKKITGTENDLRKLTMKQMASLLRSYGLGQKEIDSLKRWDRVHVIRDLSTKAASDGMADGLERYARGEKMRLRDQKRMYQDRIQEIWRRQRAALSADTGARGGGEPGEVTDADEGKEASAVDKKLDEEMKAAESDDSDDDDDLAAAFEEDLMDVKETSELVTAQIRGTGDDTAFRAMGGRTKEDRQDLSKDARELAALKRQRQEEREAQGLMGSTENASVPQRSLAGRKVIKRRITKTHPDGSQTTTFKFIVLPAEVEKVLEAKKAKEEQTKATEKKKRRSRHRFDAAKFEDDGGENVVGHSMFEDDDDDENRGGGIKIKVQRRTVKKKGGGAASSPSKSSASAYSKPKTSTVPVNKSFGKTTVGGKGKKKRKREEEEDDFYENKFFKKGNSNRRERGSARERMPHVIFADRLEGIRASVERRSNSGAFHRPVSRRDIPRYYEVVSQPISLLEIGDRISKYSYKTADAMVADFDLMKNNAIKFNGAESGLAKEASDMYEYAKSAINDNRAEFDAMEEAVDDQMSGKKKKKKKKFKASSKQSEAARGSGGGSGMMADVVLDGVTTSVDVGDLDNFNFDAESDSDEDDLIGKLNL